MRILFVSKGKAGKPSIIIQNQGESLVGIGLSVEYFLIQGNGMSSYFRSLLELRRKLKSEYYDIVHAHYVYSGIVTYLANAKNLVISLMGSDIINSPINKYLCHFLSRKSNTIFIAKSEQIAQEIGSVDAKIIPNGVNLTKFKPIPREIAISTLQWGNEFTHILFGSDATRKEKNYDLVINSINSIDNNNIIIIHELKDIPSDEVPIYLNASDVVLLSSHYEGSPNIIKEAMACNRPIVSTDVGDVKNNISDIEGCFIAEANPASYSACILKAISFAKLNWETSGRQSIIDRGLDERSIALKVMDVYKSFE